MAASASLASATEARRARPEPYGVLDAEGQDRTIRPLMPLQSPLLREYPIASRGKLAERSLIG